MVDGIQPYLRFIYVKYMGGVDLADQYLMSHFHQHRPQTYFWRRVFDPVSYTHLTLPTIYSV